MLGLRLKEGIDLEYIKKEFDVDFLSEKYHLLKKFIENKLMQKEVNKINLTVKGFLISNYIIGELLA